MTDEPVYFDDGESSFWWTRVRNGYARFHKREAENLADRTDC